MRKQALIFQLDTFQYFSIYIILKFSIINVPVKIICEVGIVRYSTFWKGSVKGRVS